MDSRAFCQGAIIAEAVACRLHTPQKVFILLHMNSRSQTLALTSAPSLLLASSLLLAGLLLRASAN
jgi:hypothetical protein